MKNQSLLFSTIFLTLINVLVRIIGFGYRIVLVRLIGTEGLGLFELVFPITMLIFTLVGSGVPIAMIRLTSQSIANNKKGLPFKILEYASIIMLLFSISLSILLFIGAPFIAKNILKDARLVTPLYIFAPAILFPSLSALLRGYFYGAKNVIPPALSQFIEQIVKIVIVLTLLNILSPFHIENAISISMIGHIAGEMVGMFLLLLFYRRAKKNFQSHSEIPKGSFMKTISSFSAIALPITLSRVISSLLRVATSVVVPGRLMASGLDHATSLSYFGQVNGMVMPLLFIPFTLTSALVINLIPRISDAVERKNKSLLHYYIDRTLHIAFLIGLPISGIYLLFSEEIIFLLYGETNALYLSQLSIATLFLCVYQVSTSILQGMGKQLISTIYFICGMILQLIITYVLVGYPDYRISGYILSFNGSFFIISLLCFLSVFKYSDSILHIRKWIVLPTLATILSLFISKFVYNFIYLYFQGFIPLFLSILIMGIVYLIILLVSKDINFSFKPMHRKP